MHGYTSFWNYLHPKLPAMYLGLTQKGSLSMWVLVWSFMAILWCSTQIRDWIFQKDHQQWDWPINSEPKDQPQDKNIQNELRFTMTTSVFTLPLFITTLKTSIQPIIPTSAGHYGKNLERNRRAHKPLEIMWFLVSRSSGLENVIQNM